MFADVGSTVGDNAFGSFELVSGVWTYTLNNAAVQDLDAGDSVVDTITYTASDGSTQQITVTINGTNDAPVITNDGGGATAGVTVEEDVTAVTTVTASDVDNDPGDLTYSIVAGGADNTAFDIDTSTGEAYL